MGEVNTFNLEDYNTKVLGHLKNNTDYDFEGRQTKYEGIADEDFTVDVITVKTKIDDLATIQHRWNGYYYQERYTLTKLERTLEDFENVFFKKFSEMDDPRFQNLNAKALARKISDQPAIRELNRIIAGQELLVSYVNESMNTSKYTINTQCKLIVEMLKQESVL
jgi:hypothetical protein